MKLTILTKYVDIFLIFANLILMLMANLTY